MKVVIPAAGRGTRLRPHTITKPKPLLPVAGSTIIDLIMDKVMKFDNLEEVIFIIGYLGDVLQNYIEKKYPNVKTRFVVQKEFKGLGHAIYQTKEFVSDDDDLLIILGDTIFDADLSEAISDKLNYLGVYKVEDQRRFGVAVMEGEYIKKLVEKPKDPVSKLALMGVYYIVNGTSLYKAIEYIMKNNITTKNEYQVTDALDKMISEGDKFKIFYATGWYDCGDKVSTLDTNVKLMKHQVLSNDLSNTEITEPVAIAASAKISNCSIGPNVHIGEGAVLENAKIKNSIIGENCEIKETKLIDSIVSDNSKVSGGKDNENELNLGEYSEIIL